ncbi:MAG: hypothetical protein NXI24_21140 [bacterium]|nr:hypothetical protein [bacterium]
MITFDSLDFFSLLFASALLLSWLTGRLSRRSPADHPWFAYVSAAAFCGLLFATLPVESSGSPEPFHNRWFSLALAGASLAIAYYFRKFSFGIAAVFGCLLALDIAEQLLAVRSVAGDPARMLAPLGFSYLLFRWFDAWRTHYTTDSSKRATPREILLQTTALPILPAGPIVLAGQFRVERRPLGLDALFYRRALLFCALGFAKIGLLAPVLRQHFSSGLVFAPAFSLDFFHNALTTGFYFYARLFIDFSGYSDLAVGVCGLLGLRIRHNFARPYFALTLRDFWRRWHITLAAFLRRHVYLPLGGNRRNHARNLLIVFLLLGLWHGTTPAFALWGILHGAYLILEIRVITPWRLRGEALLPNHQCFARGLRILQYASTHCFVALSWLVFGASGGILDV